MPSPSEGDPPQPRATKRERSTRYPGVTLAEAIKFCEAVDDLGVDGLSATDIASALGFKNIKTNTFSAPLSAARQFGLLELAGKGYGLTPLAREIIHPVDPADLSRLHRQALKNPPLYAELAERMSGKKLPDAVILGNVLYHSYQIIASAKQAAAANFLESARFAGAVGDDNVFDPNGVPVPSRGVSQPNPTASRKSAPAPQAQSVDSSGRGRARSSEVRVDLRLWDADDGKSIRVRAPKSITPASFDRFLQAFRLLVRIEEPAGPGTSE